MAVWKYSGKEVNEEDIERVEKALSQVCFGCGDLHSNECPFSIAREEVANLKG
jgi:hypothetical protein